MQEALHRTPPKVLSMGDLTFGLLERGPGFAQNFPTILSMYNVSCCLLERGPSFAHALRLLRD
jgi:hypothetical protein